MKLAGLDILVVGNPPPGFGGRYFIFVKLTTACGIVGWGEVYAATVGPDAMRAVIADVFARHMEGESPENIELMFRRAYSSGFTQRADPTVMGAFSGLEIACWDILGKARDRPVHALWGGRVRDRLRAYTYLYPEPGEDPATFYSDPDASAARAARMVREGFTAVKFDPAGAYTIRGGHQPSIPDLDRSEAFCKRIREAVGDRADLLFGTHGQFTPAGAIRLARRIARYDPLWFEEPIPPDLPLDLARVAAQSPVPIAAGERLTTAGEFATLLRAGGVSILQPSLGRVGGLLQARKVAILAEGFGAQIAPHLYAGPIAWAAAIQLALSIPNFLILESIGSGAGFHADLLTRRVTFEDGYVLPPDAPGLGVEIDEAVARAHPWTGDRLHLEMSSDPPDPRGGAPFAGG
ncbi:mandelate racemase/muconate lactonizing enzyme family protein [uncultured Amaricoccus sp.]|uniref:mandelate racemase/muconate lactonizing enzyme family protein n=1 Tax=uncultured Amaricoccus sp. TaxID=339341 RepID=UPI002612039A|nr:mandelate racemase/muconate lactonizing enzyme family protein [uncultured Amaricoccus sp.]